MVDEATPRSEGEADDTPLAPSPESGVRELLILGRGGPDGEEGGTREAPLTAPERGAVDARGALHRADAAEGGGLAAEGLQLRRLSPCEGRRRRCTIKRRTRGDRRLAVALRTAPRPTDDGPLPARREVGQRAVTRVLVAETSSRSSRRSGDPLAEAVDVLSRRLGLVPCA